MEGVVAMDDILREVAPAARVDPWDAANPWPMAKAPP
jgi:hypothetical protein